MDISPEPYVIGQIPADMVRIVVDDDVVAVPVPSVAEGHIIRRHAEVEAAEPEASRPAAGQMPVMLRPESAIEAAMLPGMVQMIVRIFPAGVVAYPVVMAA